MTHISGQTRIASCMQPDWLVGCGLFFGQRPNIMCGTSSIKWEEHEQNYESLWYWKSWKKRYENQILFTIWVEMSALKFAWSKGPFKYYVIKSDGCMISVRVVIL